ncbi:MAG: Asp-tRNA(Asn)/Glu-tRNA(Gln) amidotransferase subunit GatB [Thermoprotei archaeon]
MIGLEVHVQLNRLKTKLFCGCRAEYQGLAPNTNVCPVCLGLPGSLPVLNKAAVRHAIMVAKALNCTISRSFNFVRKNYFYPDMTKNFQISQYEKAGGVPVAHSGWLSFTLNSSERIIRIRRIQIEEDPGRLEHPEGIGSSKYTLVDYNRAGVGLLEIVTEPDLASPEEARVFIQKLRSVLEHLGVCDTAREGAIRADANVSVDGGNRVEVKNISSYKEIVKAIEFEALRQTKIVEAGGTVTRETRHWLEAKGMTMSSRQKEEEQDYRFFPEPDIPVINVNERTLEEIFASMPELPDARAKRFVEQYGLKAYDANVLVLDKGLADYFEEAAKLYTNPKIVANWIQTEVLRQLNERKIEIQKLAVTPSYLAEILRMVDTGEISGKIGKRVLVEVANTGLPPSVVVERLGLTRIADVELIKSVAEAVFRENPKAVEDAKTNEEAVNYLIGQIMRKTRGRADPEATNKVVRQLLSGR